jgi:acyl carrier protein
MENMRQEIENALKQKLNISTIDDNATLATYGLDSLDVVEFVLDVEDKYEISFEAEETKDIKTVGELINLICSKVK